MTGIAASAGTGKPRVPALSPPRKRFGTEIAVVFRHPRESLSAARSPR